MSKRIPMISGDEVDALTKWRKYIKWRSGERKRVKQKYNRRERKSVKLKLLKPDAQEN